MPDPTKPRIHPRIRRSNTVFCATCNEAHLPDRCHNKEASNNETAYRSPRGMSPMPEPIKLGNSARSSREDTPVPSAEQPRYSLPAPTESEASGQSDRDPEDPRWSRTKLPSSKSSSPSTQGHRSPTAARRRKSIAAGRAGDLPQRNRLQETGDLRTKAAQEQRQTRAQSLYNKFEKQQEDPRYEKEREPEYVTSVQESQNQQRPNDGPDGQQQKQAVFKAYRPGVLENRDISSVDEQPGPHIPGPPSEVPSRGTSGRRRPRRPRPNTMML